jgi:predicted dehydrogenase
MKKIYNWGIIGPGSIAHKFASDLKLLPNASLYAIGSRSVERAKFFANKYGAIKAYGSYEELAKDPEVDIVYIASRHIGHYPDSMLCLQNRKAVLVEKPIGMNVNQCLAMIGMARRNKVFLMEALWTRFIPSFLKCKELIEGGAIGDITLIYADFCIKPPYDIDGRLFNPMFGGGSLLDIGLYPVFLALTLAGKPINIKAQATFTETHVDQNCSMLLKHEKDILSVLFCSLINTGRTEAMIHGSMGKIRINTMWHIPTSVDLFIDDNKPVHYAFDESGNGYQYEAAEVMRCLDEGLTESPAFSWQHSTDLISTLDAIRKEVKITYPKKIESI